MKAVDAAVKLVKSPSFVVDKVLNDFAGTLLRPPIVELETVNMCNAKCEFCLYKEKAPDKKIDISEELFISAVDQIDSLGTNQLCLVPMLGDPLLDKNLIQHLTYIHSKNNFDVVRLVTNGISFDKYTDKELILLLTVVDTLEVSLAPNQLVYKEMFGVNKFEKVVSNLYRLTKLKQQVINPPKRIVLCGRACGDDFIVDDRLEEIAELLGCGAFDWTREYMDWGGTISELPLGSKVIKADNINQKTPCKYALTPHIYYDGKVGMCACAGATEELHIGDINTQSWSEILSSSDRIQKILSFTEGKMPDYCRKCSFYSEDKKHDWRNIVSKLNEFDGKNEMKLSEEILSERQSLLLQYIVRSTGIMHLGAHRGQEASKYSNLNKDVIWVEAMPDMHALLSKNIEKFANQQAFCALLLDSDGKQQTFNISNNNSGVSSSIFDFGDFGDGKNTLWPDLGLKMVNQITLPSVTLDTLLSANDIQAKYFDYWVVDLQGAELLALKGAKNSLKSCKALYVEVSEVEVYKEAVQFEDLKKFLGQNGFIPLWDIALPHDDILFVKRSELNKVVNAFRSEEYLRHTSSRLEHLASLNLDLTNKKVLEVGAGIGDHTNYYLSRDCEITVTDVRAENIIQLQKRFGNNKKVTIDKLDLEKIEQVRTKLGDDTFDVIHCYGLLYHLNNPLEALSYFAEIGDILLLETCVSTEMVEANVVSEPSHSFSQAFSGEGCRPNRSWVWNILNRLYPHVYIPRTQPRHEEFPISWENVIESDTKLTRAIYIASKKPISNNNLVTELLKKQFKQL